MGHIQGFWSKLVDSLIIQEYNFLIEVVIGISMFVCVENVVNLEIVRILIMFASTINVLKGQMGALKGKTFCELNEIIMIQIQLFYIM